MQTDRMEVNTNLPVIADVQITTDNEGRFNLNALHKAHLAQNPNLHRNSKQPADWLKLEGTKQLADLISNSEDLSCVAVTTKEGRYGGTFDQSGHNRNASNRSRTKQDTSGNWVMLKKLDQSGYNGNASNQHAAKAKRQTVFKSGHVRLKSSNIDLKLSLNTVYLLVHAGFKTVYLLVKAIEFLVHLACLFIKPSVQIVFGDHLISKIRGKDLSRFQSLFVLEPCLFKASGKLQCIKRNVAHASYIAESNQKNNNKAIALTRVSEYDSSVAHVTQRRVGITNLSVYWRSQPRLIFKRGFFMVGRSGVPSGTPFLMAVTSILFVRPLARLKSPVVGFLNQALGVQS